MMGSLEVLEGPNEQDRAEGAIVALLVRRGSQRQIIALNREQVIDLLRQLGGLFR